MPSPQSSTETEEHAQPLPPVKLDPLAGFLSYLIPGMGQVYQGRVGKGCCSFFGLYLLFFYGMWMGQWRNVWLPDVSDMPQMEIGGYQVKGVPSASGTGRSSWGNSGSASRPGPRSRSI